MRSTIGDSRGQEQVQCCQGGEKEADKKENHVLKVSSTGSGREMYSRERVEKKDGKSGAAEGGNLMAKCHSKEYAEEKDRRRGAARTQTK